MQVKVTGDGITAVNGIYKRYTLLNGMQYYKKVVSNDVGVAAIAAKADILDCVECSVFKVQVLDGEDQKPIVRTGEVATADSIDKAMQYYNEEQHNRYMIALLPLTTGEYKWYMFSTSKQHSKVKEYCVYYQSKDSFNISSTATVNKEEEKSNAISKVQWEDVEQGVGSVPTVVEL